MLTNKDYCDYELRLGLRDIGYPMSTCQINDGPIQMPKITLYEAQKFLREEKNLNVNIRAFIENGWYYTIQDCKGNPILSQLVLTDELYSTYQKAISEGVRKVVEILKEKD